MATPIFSLLMGAASYQGLPRLSVGTEPRDCYCKALAREVFFTERPCVARGVARNAGHNLDGSQVAISGNRQHRTTASICRAIKGSDAQ